LRLVFVNLIENAFDAMADHSKKTDRAPHLEICGCMAAAKLGDTQPRVEIRVSDTGPGVPPETREHLFDLAYSTKRTPGRLGFGLWWVKTLVLRFGGEIFVAEDASVGSTFVMRLPCATAQADESASRVTS
jgi:signal transduction histidine kinase